MDSSVDAVIIGMGYVGLPLAREASAAGLSVIGLDVHPEVVDGLNHGRSHVDDLADAAFELIHFAGAGQLTFREDAYQLAFVQGLRDVDEGQLTKARAIIATSLDRMVANAKLTAEDREALARGLKAQGSAGQAESHSANGGTL